MTTQKVSFFCNLREIEDGIFAYPIWAQNGLFLAPRGPFWPRGAHFGPEGPIVTPNLKNIVLQRL